MANQTERKQRNKWESFGSHYRRVDGYATSLLATLSWCQDDTRRMEEIKAFSVQADVFLCELRARGEKLKVGKSQRYTEKIDDDICEVHDLLYQFVHDPADMPGTLQQLRIAASRLYDKVITNQNITETQGHLDFFSGAWVWDELPKLRKTDRAILKYYSDHKGWVQNKRYTEDMREQCNYGDSTLYGRRKVLIQYGLIEEQSPKSTLYRITESGINYSSQKSSC